MLNRDAVTHIHEITGIKKIDIKIEIHPSEKRTALYFEYSRSLIYSAFSPISTLARGKLTLFASMIIKSI